MAEQAKRTVPRLRLRGKLTRKEPLGASVSEAPNRGPACVPAILSTGVFKGVVGTRNGVWQTISKPFVGCRELLAFIKAEKKIHNANHFELWVE